MGIFLAMGSLVVIVITALLGALSALRKEPVWKDWLLGTLAGFLLFFISLFIIPGPAETFRPQETIMPSQQDTANSAEIFRPQQTIVPSQQDTTSSAVYK